MKAVKITPRRENAIPRLYRGGHVSTARKIRHRGGTPQGPLAKTRGTASVACEAAPFGQQGELARRHLGYDKGPIIEAATIRATYYTERDRGPQARDPRRYGARLWPGSRRRKNDEIDLGLAELNAQKTT